MEKILIMDFGGQYSQLIARKVRELHVYAEIRSCQNTDVSRIEQEQYKGIILTGGPESVYKDDSPKCSAEVLKTGIPVLGICYGFQLMAYLLGGRVSQAAEGSEYGRTELYLTDKERKNTCCSGVLQEDSKEAPDSALRIFGLLSDIPECSIVWMSHSDRVTAVPEGFDVSAETRNCPIAAFSNDDKKLYGVQFHPEVTHTEYGMQVLENFLFKICGCAGDWRMDDFLETSIRKYRKELAGKKVLLALSGGVDSAVAGVLLHKAVGQNLKCVFVDHGLMRKNEGDEVERIFKDHFGMNFVRLNVKERFLEKLAGVTEPEQKRKIIGSEFVRVFEEEAARTGGADVLAQGTIYPDVIESGKGASAVIKSHHNVGGLPKDILFKEIAEPLRKLFKDEVRKLGERLGLPRELLYRQPFPGPGLAVRIIGEVTGEKLEMLKEADAIFREELERYTFREELEWYTFRGELERHAFREEPEWSVTREKPWRSEMKEIPNQYFAVLTGIRTVGVMGDSRTYGQIIALRSVDTDDFMTAEWSRIPYEVLNRASLRITNEVKGVSRVVYDITSKPPATVEWE